MLPQRATTKPTRPATFPPPSDSVRSRFRSVWDSPAPGPSWLTRQRLTIFERRVERDESLTLGANSEDANAKGALMYLVFVAGGAATSEGHVNTLPRPSRGGLQRYPS